MLWVKMYAELYRDSVGIETWIKSHVITKLCDPDYCVYTNAKNEVSKAAKTNLRSAGQVI